MIECPRAGCFLRIKRNPTSRQASETSATSEELDIRRQSLRSLLHAFSRTPCRSPMEHIRGSPFQVLQVRGRNKGFPRSLRMLGFDDGGVDTSSKSTSLAAFPCLQSNANPLSKMATSPWVCQMIFDIKVGKVRPQGHHGLRISTPNIVNKQLVVRFR